MTQPDEWKSPYDPPQQPSTPEPGPGPVPTPEPAPGQAGPPSPYHQPYPQAPAPYPQAPAPYQPGQQGYPYQAQPYQPQPYQTQPYQPQPGPYGSPYGYTAPPEKNALGIWSLVLGILSVIMLFSCFVGVLAGIPAVITGHLSRKAHKEGLADNPGLALAGIITGWVTIGLTILGIIGLALLFSIPEFREGFSGETTTTYDY